MAHTKVCSNCGAKNPSSNRFCEDCGYDMDKAKPSAAPITGLYCPLGHTISDPSLGFCDVCGEKLTSVMPVPPKMEDIPVHKPFIDDTPAPPAAEHHGKKCPRCGAMNDEDDMFCEECGMALTVAEPVNIAEPAPKPSIPHSREHELPDIPGIMRTLTNNDMKR